MKQKCNCKPIPYTLDFEIKYIVTTRYSDYEFDDIADYHNFISELVNDDETFDVTIQTIQKLYYKKNLLKIKLINEHLHYFREFFL